MTRLRAKVKLKRRRRRQKLQRLRRKLAETHSAHERRQIIAKIERISSTAPIPDS